MSTSASTPNTVAEPAVLDIAVGILCATDGRVLIAQRRPGTMGAGYWEFPGGKHEAGESMYDTLARELQEELGIVPLQARHLIRMRNPAATRPVRLHVWLVTQWQGRPHGREGQRIEWCRQRDLPNWRLLPGNRALLNALALPARVVIATGAAGDDRLAWQPAPAVPPALLCLIAPTLDDIAYAEWVRPLLLHAKATGTAVLLDRRADMVRKLGAAGLYWPARQAAAVSRRSLGPEYLLGVTAGDADEMRLAARAEADFAVLSMPHVPFDWPGWRCLRADFGLPVYADMGAVVAGDLAVAREHNAQGLACIVSRCARSGGG